MLDSIFRKALSDAKGKLDSKVKECEQLKRDREDIAAAPGTRDDVIAIIGEQIDKDAADYQAFLFESIQNTIRFGNGPSVGPDGLVIPVAIATARRHANLEARPRDVERSLSFLLGAEIKKAIATAIRGMAWPYNAQPLGGRASRLAKLDEKIAALESEISSMRAEARDAGVML